MECKNKAYEQYMPLLFKDNDQILNKSRPVQKRKGNTGFFSNAYVIPFVA